jgi:hypothetical protein
VDGGRKFCDLIFLHISDFLLFASHHSHLCKEFIKQKNFKICGFAGFSLTLRIIFQET